MVEGVSFRISPGGATVCWHVLLRRKACLGYSYYPVSFGFGVKVLLIMGMGCSTIMSAQFAFTNKDFRLALSRP